MPKWTAEEWREYRARRKIGAALQLVLPQGSKIEDFPTITDELLRRTLSAVSITVARNAMYLAKAVEPADSEPKTLVAYLQCLDLIITIKGKLAPVEEAEEGDSDSAKKLSDEDLDRLAAGGPDDG